LLNNISWIFFDVGSTLVDESKAFHHRINDAIENSKITYSQFYDTMIDFYKRNMKGDLETIKLFNLNKTAWHKEEEMVYPQSADILAMLNRKYRIGIIANQSLGTEQRLKEMGLIDYIDLVIASAEEGISKPDIKIFQLALKRAECAAENAVMVGDRLDNDIIPAKSIGMKTIWIKQGFGGLATPSNEMETPDYIVNDLDEFRSIFE